MHRWRYTIYFIPSSDYVSLFDFFLWFLLDGGVQGFQLMVLPLSDISPLPSRKVFAVLGGGGGIRGALMWVCFLHLFSSLEKTHFDFKEYVWFFYTGGGAVVEEWWNAQLIVITLGLAGDAVDVESFSSAFLIVDIFLRITFTKSFAVSSIPTWCGFNIIFASFLCM